MSTWTAPVTWVAAAVTAASMNTEIRDHLNFLKGSLDLITNSTTADVGTTTYLGIVGANTAANAYIARVTGDAFQRLVIDATGSMLWGSGAVVGDTNLYRNGVSELRTDDLFISAGFTTYVGTHVLRRYALAADAQPTFSIENANGEHRWGLGGSTVFDTNLYRFAANVLTTDDQFSAGGGLTTKTKAGVPSDVDVQLATDGTIVLDTTNHRLYVRSGAVWKYAALV